MNNIKKLEENTLFFVGNQHETVPLRLLQDHHLTARAKFAYQIIKIHARAFNSTVFPSYDELQNLLSDTAYKQEKCSRKIVSQTLLLLRLTRWLTLCDTSRDEKGRILGNIYLIHDEPLSVLDCVHFNEQYLELLESCTKHSDKIVRDVAISITHEIKSSQQSYLVSHIDLILERYQHYQTKNLTDQKLSSIFSVRKLSKNQQNLPSSIRELSENQQNLPSSIRELSKNQQNLLSSQDEVLSTSTIKYNKYSTSTINIPNEFNFSQLEKKRIFDLIQNLQLSSKIAQSVLVEACMRVRAGGVQKPLNYVCHLLRTAKKGDFKEFLINKNPNKNQRVESISNISTRSVRSNDELQLISKKATILKNQLRSM
ncbi:hypothetical protein CEP48_00170 [Mergibacter septicus]|uniref:Uncharacterized protein n=1 Tax=Mergibacter septicus TaxID=221402 RepID=A0A8E3MFK2_9PAST|nr:STY4528 family pathogenicity island replication protein [Mergibacter septicus]AWX14698.1 hypothetical protein CEP47_00170 [Mergibacter septicus]QDJ13949.1 hypothetical protein CEP48_00170 [Mergibacter septicus]UTU48602.1 hypothetical protein HLL31_07465 [Mergibacter septicus]WMR95770.1 STY4528 family pathogenicity island replication protein [Mergibacter septicus]